MEIQLKAVLQVSLKRIILRESLFDLDQSSVNTLLLKIWRQWFIVICLFKFLALFLDRYRLTLAIGVKENGVGALTGDKFVPYDYFLFLLTVAPLFSLSPMKLSVAVEKNVIAQVFLALTHFWVQFLQLLVAE